MKKQNHREHFLIERKSAAHTYINVYDNNSGPYSFGKLLSKINYQNGTLHSLNTGPYLALTKIITDNIDKG